MGSLTMAVLRWALLALCAAVVLSQDPDAVLSDPDAAVTAKADAATTPEQTEDGISTRLNQDTGSDPGAQTADGAAAGKDMVCVCKRIKKPQNVKCNRTVEIEEPPQDPKTLKELVQCTPGGHNLTQAQRLLLRKEAKQRQEMELAQEKFEVDQVKLMTTCLSGHCNPASDLNPPRSLRPLNQSSLWSATTGATTINASPSGRILPRAGKTGTPAFSNACRAATSFNK